jgi:hypothetical protein
MNRFLFSATRLFAPSVDGDGGSGEAGVYDLDPEDESIDTPTEQDESEDTTEGKDDAAEPPVPAKAPAAAVPSPAGTPPATPETAPAPKGLSAEEIKAIADAVRGPQVATPAQAAPKTAKEKSWDELTPEEYNERSARVVITPEFMNSLGFTDATPEQIAGFQSFSDNTARHALTIAEAYLNQRLGELESKFAPMASAYNKYEQEATKESFYSQYPANKGQDALIQALALKVSPSHPDGRSKNQQEIFAELDRLAGAVRSSMGVTAGNPTTTPTPVPAVRTVPKPANLSQPGRSAGASQGNPNQPKNQDADIYN